MSTRYGPPEVVTVREWPDPQVGPGDVLVRVHAGTVNRTDCGFRGAKPFVIRAFSGLRAPRANVWGTEYAGVVEEVGEDVTGFRLGDRVFGYGEKRFGGHGELAAVDAGSMLAHIPGGVSFEEAAAATEGGHYALGFIARTGVQPGQKVMVYGATGAIGSAAVQLLVDLGVDLTAVCGTEHVGLVAGLGAARVIDYQSEDFTRAGDDFDVVIDAVGKSTFAACRPLLTSSGSYVSSDLGPWGQNPLLALVTPALPGRRVHFPVPKENPGIIEHLRSRLESGAYRPVIDRRYPLEDIVEAWRYVETGQKVGNVVITMPAASA